MPSGIFLFILPATLATCPSCRLMKPSYLTLTSTASASHRVKPPPSPNPSSIAVSTSGRRRSSSSVKDCLLGFFAPPAPALSMAWTTSESLLTLVFFSRSSSSSTARILSVNIPHRSSSIRPHSRPIGVSRWSALSDLSTSLYSDRLVSMRYGSRRSLVQRSSMRVPR